MVRNEALDCRDYALAAFKGFPFDLTKAKERLMGEGKEKPKATRKP